MIARFLFTAAHALFWAATDARDIRNGKDINHPVRWAIRAAIEVVASLVTMPIGWETALVTIAAAFLFSALFRFLLNTMRCRHWAYVSPSSWYDWWWMSHLPKGWKHHQRPFVVNHFSELYSEDDCFRKYLHRAGALAYIFEAVVFAILAYLSAVL